LLLGGELAVLQAAMFDGLSLNPFALFDDGWRPAEAGIGRDQVVQGLVATLVVVVLDERLDLDREVAGLEVVFQEDAVLQRLGPVVRCARPEPSK
jgi:hypothetical protein